MCRENAQFRALWPKDGDIVPIAPPPAAVVVGGNGDLADGDAGGAPQAAPSPRLGAGDFTPERMLRSASDAPAAGWRRTLNFLSGGTVARASSARERRQRELVAQVKAPITCCRKIAFISRKGGVGKTTTCLLAGHTFASYRGDRVIALDANPDAGTLAHRLRRETSETVATLLRDREALGRYADVRAYTSQTPTRLEVIAGDERSQLADTLLAADIEYAIEVLERHYNLLCLDTAAGVLGSAAQGVLAAADEVVIVSAASLDAARAASLTLDWLEQHGYDDLASTAVAVLNTVKPERTTVDVTRIEEHFARRCRFCVRIPWDPHLHAGADVALDQLRPDTRQAFLELAAAVACGFNAPGEGRS